jgi:hypothetical protein
MEMLQMDDIKVVTANVVCMVMVQLENLNTVLQAILIVATITYTVARTVNEIKKIQEKRKKIEEDTE